MQTIQNVTVFGPEIVFIQFQARKLSDVASLIVDANGQVMDVQLWSKAPLAQWAARIGREAQGTFREARAALRLCVWRRGSSDTWKPGWFHSFVAETFSDKLMSGAVLSPGSRAQALVEAADGRVYSLHLDDVRLGQGQLFVLDEQTLAEVISELRQSDTAFSRALGNALNEAYSQEQRDILCASFAALIETARVAAWRRRAAAEQEQATEEGHDEVSGS